MTVDGVTVMSPGVAGVCAGRAGLRAPTRLWAALLPTMNPEAWRSGGEGAQGPPPPWKGGAAVARVGPSVCGTCPRGRSQQEGLRKRLLGGPPAPAPAWGPAADRAACSQSEAKAFATGSFLPPRGPAHLLLAPGCPSSVPLNSPLDSWGWVYCPISQKWKLRLRAAWAGRAPGGPARGGGDPGLLAQCRPPPTGRAVPTHTCGLRMPVLVGSRPRRASADRGLGSRPCSAWPGDPTPAWLWGRLLSPSLPLFLAPQAPAGPWLRGHTVQGGNRGGTRLCPGRGGRPGPGQMPPHQGTAASRALETEELTCGPTKCLPCPRPGPDLPLVPCVRL